MKLMWSTLRQFQHQVILLKTTKMRLCVVLALLSSCLFVSAETHSSSSPSSPKSPLQISVSTACNPKSTIGACGLDALGYTLRDETVTFALADGVENRSPISSLTFASNMVTNALALPKYSTTNTLKDAFVKSIMNLQDKAAITASIGSIDLRSGKLTYTGFGDIRLLVIRDHSVEFISKDRGFHMPFYLEHLPNRYLHTEIQTTCKVLSKYTITESFHLQSGDIVITATDGVFDNVHLSEIADLVKTQHMYFTPSITQQEKADRLAKRILDMAKITSMGGHTVQRPLFARLDEFVRKCEEGGCNKIEQFLKNQMRDHVVGSLEGREDDQSVMVGIVH